MRTYTWLMTLVVLAMAAASPAAGLTRKSPEKAAPPRVLIIIADGFNHGEFAGPYGALLAMGYNVDVAGPAKGVIETGNKGRPDAQANLALKDVDVSRYFALMIPGGHSPAKLAEFPDALRICRAFMEADKPVAAICHGPRLLMQAGVVTDRPVTGLWSIKDELPELWRSPKRGRYLDQAVVRDRNLLCGRHVADLGTFLPAMLRHFADAGGVDLPRNAVRVVTIYPGADGHVKWQHSHMVRPTFVDAKVFTSTREIDGLEPQPKSDEPNAFDPLSDMDVLAVLGEGEMKGFAESDNMRRIVAAALREQRPIVASADGAKLLEAMGLNHNQYSVTTGSEEQMIADICALGRPVAAKRKPQGEPAEATDRRVAVMALHDGFDDETYAAMRALLAYHDLHVVNVAPGGDWVRGVNGLPAEVDYTYGSDKLPKIAVIVAPGVTWPQGEGDKTQAARIQWLRDQYRDGAVIIAFGRDSLEISKHEMFKGKKFACTHQAVWAFKRKTGGSYANEDALVTAERLITARGAAFAPLAMRLAAELIVEKVSIRELTVELPEQSEVASTRPRDRDLVIRMDATGAIWVGSRQVEAEQFQAIVAGFAKRDPKPRVRIEVSTRAPFGQVYPILNQLKVAGLDDWQFRAVTSGNEAGQ